MSTPITSFAPRFASSMGLIAVAASEINDGFAACLFE
jgi:hypothetical protein